MSELPAMTLTQQKALCELDNHCRHGRSPYWWRRASMQTLATLGLAEAYKPENSTSRLMAYRITDAGRRAVDKIV